MTKEEYWNEKKNLLLKEARSYRAFELGVRYSEPYIAELESKIKHLTEHLEPPTMTALFEQVEEEVRQEQSIKKLEKENAEMKMQLYAFDEEREKLRKENAELKEQISVLLSCKNCSENKGGLICQKEYENKCLAQKVQFIKELQEENAELKSLKDVADLIRLNNSHIVAMAQLNNNNVALRKENAELKEELKKWKDEWQEQVQNEWHYVKDELDTKSWKRYNKYLVRARFTTEIGKSDVPLLAYFDHYQQKWYVDRTYLSAFNVIAWKEIVLPELKEIKEK